MVLTLTDQNKWLSQQKGSSDDCKLVECQLCPQMFQVKIQHFGETWLTQLEKHATLDVRVLSSIPSLGIEIT